MKYKPCCDVVCALANCEIRDAGGCYCVCRLKGLEKSILEVLANPALDPTEKEELEKELLKVRDKLERYRND